LPPWAGESLFHRVLQRDTTHGHNLPELLLLSRVGLPPRRRGMRSLSRVHPMESHAICAIDSTDMPSSLALISPAIAHWRSRCNRSSRNPSPKTIAEPRFISDELIYFRDEPAEFRRGGVDYGLKTKDSARFVRNERGSPRCKSVCTLCRLFGNVKAGMHSYTSKLTLPLRRAFLRHPAKGGAVVRVRVHSTDP